MNHDDPQLLQADRDKSIDHHLAACHEALEETPYLLHTALHHLEHLQLLNDPGLFDGKEGDDALHELREAMRKLRHVKRLIAARCELEEA